MECTSSEFQGSRATDQDRPPDGDHVVELGLSGGEPGQFITWLGVQKPRRWCRLLPLEPLSGPRSPGGPCKPTGGRHGSELPAYAPDCSYVDEFGTPLAFQTSVEV